MVVFTLSKKRCEENAGTLTNQDLCTSVEKSEIHVAIEKATSRLKGMVIICCQKGLVSNPDKVPTKNSLKLRERATCSLGGLGSITEAYFLW